MFAPFTFESAKRAAEPQANVQHSRHSDLEYHDPVALDVHPQSLRALLAVLDTGSFTAAADRLGFTQSALSKQMSALESETGAVLFRRAPRGVEATPAAHQLARRAIVVLDQLDAAERELVASPVGGKVALGAFPTAAMSLIPRTISRVRGENPSVIIDFAASSTPVQIRRLRAGRLDLAVLAVGEGLPDYDLTGIETEPLPSGPLLVAVGAKHRLARAHRVDVAELAEESWVVGRGARGAPQFGAWPTLSDPHHVAHLADWSTRLGFVAAGLGITVVPTLAESLLPPSVTAIEVDDPRWTGRATTLARIGPLTEPTATVRTALVGEARAIAGRTAGLQD
ncbi:DNA-binding transcriptional LysR family regulator [Saccharopolyspora dendranthemae]|uniref:DNA-binding transcriptional LysR family regulator n=1 Tax=Saccharopolyspora dendranthemae TaxID=1181886 RepID=A0A561U854_9PSEU|nr:DNA-binding transcriptional LysR family regulator [Saccharopolyspora dendranthemae]